MDLSIIIPARKEPYIEKTVDSILANAVTDIEIIVLLSETKSFTRPKTIIVQQEPSWGMRGSINEGLKRAKGKFIMKCDAHCAFGPSFDRIMIEDCQENWLMIPRRFSMDEDKWTRDLHRPHRDYHYLSTPVQNAYGLSIGCVEWFKSNDKLIDDTMTFQGSCWLANKDYFMKRVGFLDSEHYGTFSQEFVEVGMKYWLGGGEVKVTKKTWYAHLFKQRRHYEANLFSRGYKRYKEVKEDYTWSTKHWMNNKEPGMIHDFKWLINKFKPPTWE